MSLTKFLFRFGSSRSFRSWRLSLSDVVHDAFSHWLAIRVCFFLFGFFVALAPLSLFSFLRKPEEFPFEMCGSPQSSWEGRSLSLKGVPLTIPSTFFFMRFPYAHPRNSITFKKQKTYSRHLFPFPELFPSFFLLFLFVLEEGGRGFTLRVKFLPWINASLATLCRSLTSGRVPPFSPFVTIALRRP